MSLPQISGNALHQVAMVTWPFCAPIPSVPFFYDVKCTLVQNVAPVISCLSYSAGIRGPWQYNLLSMVLKVCLYLLLLGIFFFFLWWHQGLTPVMHARQMLYPFAISSASLVSILRVSLSCPGCPSVCYVSRHTLRILLT